MRRAGEAIYFQGRLVGVWAVCPVCKELFSKPPMGADPNCSSRCDEAARLAAQ
jgi:hypothetical protein